MENSLEYVFLLDFFPLVDTLEEHNKTFAEILQRTALEMLMATHDQLKFDRLSRIHLLLRLGTDLGYIDQEVLRFLEKQLQKMADVRGSKDN